MKLGIISKNESYWSLQELNRNVINALRKNFDTVHLNINKTKEGDRGKIEGLYKDNDAVINLSSESIWYERKYNKPTIFFCHAWMDHGAGINFYLKRKYFRQNDIFTFASTSALKKYRRVYKSLIKSCVIPYFSGVLKPECLKDSYIRKKYSLPTNKKILIYFGRLNYEKNIEGLIRFFNDINDQNSCLVIAGSYGAEFAFGFPSISSEKYRKIIDNLINKLGLREKVFFTGYLTREEIKKLISISYLSLNTSLCYEEDFGFSVLESMMLGVPVVCSNWGGFKDIIKHNRTGYLIDTYLDNSIKPCLDHKRALIFIRKLLFSEHLRNEFSERGKRDAVKYFSEERFLKNIKNILRQIESYLYKDKIRRELIQPRREFKLAYDKGIKNRNLENFYLNNPKLFRILYSYYCGRSNEN